MHDYYSLTLLYICKSTLLIINIILALRTTVPMHQFIFIDTSIVACLMISSHQRVPGANSVSSNTLAEKHNCMCSSPARPSEGAKFAIGMAQCLQLLQDQIVKRHPTTLITSELSIQLLQKSAPRRYRSCLLVPPLQPKAGATNNMGSGCLQVSHTGGPLTHRSCLVSARFHHTGGPLTHRSCKRTDVLKSDASVLAAEPHTGLFLHAFLHTPCMHAEEHKHTGNSM